MLYFFWILWISFGVFFCAAAAADADAAAAAAAV